MNRSLKACGCAPADSRHGRVLAAAGWLLAVAAACSQPPQATVQGTVSLAGKPLTARGGGGGRPEGESTIDIDLPKP